MDMRGHVRQPCHWPQFRSTACAGDLRAAAETTERLPLAGIKPASRQLRRGGRLGSRGFGLYELLGFLAAAQPESAPLGLLLGLLLG